MNSRRALFAAALAFTAGLWPVLASAEGDGDPAVEAPTESARADARRLIDEGNQLLADGILGSALTKYEAAYRLVPSVKIRLNIAEVHMRMGSIELAAQEYDLFLKDADGRMPLVNSVRSRLSELEKMLGSLVVECSTPDVEIELDGRILGKAPVPRVLVKPGPHTLRARAVDRQTFTAQVDVPLAEAVRVLVVLEPLLVAAPAVVPPRPSIPATPPVAVRAVREESSPITSKWWFWAGLGAIVAAGAGTAIALSMRSQPASPELGASALDDWTPR